MYGYPVVWVSCGLGILCGLWWDRSVQSLHVSHLVAMHYWDSGRLVALNLDQMDISKISVTLVY